MYADTSQALGRGLQLPAGHVQLCVFLTGPKQKHEAAQTARSCSNFAATSPLSDPNIPLSALFSKSLSVRLQPQFTPV